MGSGDQNPSSGVPMPSSCVHLCLPAKLSLQPRNPVSNSSLSRTSSLAVSLIRQTKVCPGLLCTGPTSSQEFSCQCEGPANYNTSLVVKLSGTLT